MKSILLAALLLGGTALAAHAERFTFKANGTVQNAIQITGEDGKPVGGAFQSGTTETVWASGKASHGTYTCESHTAMPNEIFQFLGVCTAKDEAGTFYELIGCDSANKAMTEDNCWAGMFGTGGAYAGKHGRATWHGTGSPDGKTGEALGEGAWGD
jgi:hypothetical protein